MSGDRWLESCGCPRFFSAACGKRGADVRPDFDWNEKAGSSDGISMMGRIPAHSLPALR